MPAFEADEQVTCRSPPTLLSRGPANEPSCEGDASGRKRERILMGIIQRRHLDRLAGGSDDSGDVIGAAPIHPNNQDGGHIGVEAQPDELAAVQCLVLAVLPATVWRGDQEDARAGMRLCVRPSGSPVR